MARALRITYPGAFYHVTSLGNEPKAVFKSKIVETPGEYDWSSHNFYIGKQRAAKWLYRGFGKDCKNVSLSEIDRQKIKGNRSAFWHRGIRGITDLQACSPKDRKRSLVS